MTHRKPTQTRARRARQPQKPTGPRVSVQVADFPLSQQATAEPPHRSRMGRRYDARMEGRKGSTRGPKLRVQPVTVVRLAALALAVLVLLALAGRL